jgi:hypothetical protein
MESGGSLSYSQKHTTSPYPEPDRGSRKPLSKQSKNVLQEQQTYQQKLQ